MESNEISAGKVASIYATPICANHVDGALRCRPGTRSKSADQSRGGSREGRTRLPIIALGG